MQNFWTPTTYCNSLICTSNLMFKIFALSDFWIIPNLTNKNPQKIGSFFPASIYLLKVNIGNTQKMCDVWSLFKVNNKDISTTSVISFCVFIFNFEQVSHIALVFFIIDFEQVNSDWVVHLSGAFRCFYPKLISSSCGTKEKCCEPSKRCWVALNL